jgi:hypothetical protein
MIKAASCILAFLVISYLYSSCYYDKEEDLYPNYTQSCDTSNVTYSQTIAPIMAANCNVCHSTVLHSGGVVTENRDGLKIVADNGKLIPAVEQTGFYPMPKGGNKLQDCDLAKINIWVRAGAPNN